MFVYDHFFVRVDEATIPLCSRGGGGVISLSRVVLVGRLCPPHFDLHGIYEACTRCVFSVNSSPVIPVMKVQNIVFYVFFIPCTWNDALL